MKYAVACMMKQQEGTCLRVHTGLMVLEATSRDEAIGQFVVAVTKEDRGFDISGDVVCLQIDE